MAGEDDRPMTFLRKHSSTILVLVALAIVLVGTIIALSVGYDARDRTNKEQLARKVQVATAVCHSNNNQNQKFLDYLRGLADGSNTSTVPIPTDLPSSFRAFLEGSRAANRAYALKALTDAQKTFKVVDCK